MVWGLFPADPLSGENKYYIFSKGTYKVGRKGCDVIINKDKGVSRVHAEIVIDAMILLDHRHRNIASKVKVRDCSKYGTFINKDLVSKKKVHEFPSKETTLQDGDLVSFGTGNATYRFSFVPFKFSVCCSVPFQKLQEKISSIGASAIRNWSMECTHVLVDEITPLNEDVVDAIVAKKPIVCHKWVEFIAETNICSEIPSCSSHAPTLKVEGLSVIYADSISRENCLRGYTFLLESALKYQLKDRLQALLEVSGAKVIAVEAFYQGSEGEGNERIILVIPAGLADGSEGFRHLSFLLRVNEIQLICATLSGKLDPSVLVSPPVVITSSCSTDETVVADSDEEIETAIPVPDSVAVDIDIGESESGGKGDVIMVMSGDQDAKGHIFDTNIETLHSESKRDIITNDVEERSETQGKIAYSKDRYCSKMAQEMKDEDSDSKTSDIIYSQDLIIRDLNLPAKVRSSMKNSVVNFKRFRKLGMQSGNSFNNLIPYAKHPYKDSDYGNEEVAESVKEEKRRKQMEAVADDLFNNEKGKRRGAASSLHVFATSQGDSAEYSPQSRVCTDNSTKCGGRQIYCPRQCPTFKASNEKGKGCFIDCNARDCEAICKTRKPNCNGIGSACYDPRFVGGDGVMFYFHGKTNEHFSLVSDTNFHINARFIGRRPQGRSRDNTWIQALGLMFGSHTFTLSANKVAKWETGVDQFLFTYDTLPIHIPSGHINTWTSPDSNLIVERTTLYNSISLTLPNILEMSVNVVPVTKEDDRLHNYQIPANDCFAHLEVQFKLFSLTDKVEGVLGQTYRPEFQSPVKRGVPMPVMGGEDKFITSSLLAADCKKCIFAVDGPNAAAKSMLLDGDMTVDCTSRSTSHSHGFACRR